MSQPLVSRRALHEHSPNRNLLRAIRPLPEHNIVYVKNPKAGCTTLLLWLDRMHTGDLESDPSQIHTNHHLPGVREIGWRQVREMLSGSAYRFSFVRDPVRRFESAYWDKIAHQKSWRPKVQVVLGLPEDPESPVSFEQFLDAVEQQDPVAGMDPHWRPQHLNLLHPLVTYDRIGRLESFDEDLRLVCEEASLPRVPVQVRNGSKRRRPPGSVYDGRPDLVARVEQIYAGDMELYGY